jgi:aminopeptidase N
MTRMSSLTREEAVTRAGLISVDGYEIDLDLTTGDETFRSRTIARFRCTDPAPGMRSFAELKPARLITATLNGAPVELVGHRLVLPELAADNILVVEAEMAYTNMGTGLHRFTDPADGRVYLYAGSFLDDAARIFACFDQPDIKAPLALTVLADPQWTVRANGAGERVGDGRWKFAVTPPLSTYLMTLVAGEWHVIEAVHDGIPLGVLCRASLAEHLDREAAEILTVTRQSFDRYHELFGVRYPFGKYDQAFVPEFNAGAMENPGCVTFRDELVFRSVVTEAERVLRAVIIAHEMAHMWFGDLVTMRWWDDLWLNESFAEYLGFRVAAEVTRFTEAWALAAISRKAWGYAADQRPSTHPVAGGEVPDAASALLNFDGISYAKGASALKQLVAWIGDDAFFNGLNAYFADHAFGNATLHDFLTAMADASGQDIAAWAELWLRRSGVNTLRPVSEVGDDGRYRTFWLSQEGATLRPHKVGVALFDRPRPQTNPTQARSCTADVAGERTDLPALVGAPAADLVLVNHGDLTYAKIRLNTVDCLPAVLAAADPLTSALVWGAVWDATRDAELAAREFLALVIEALPSERSVVIVADVITFAREAADLYLVPDEHESTVRGLTGAYAARLTQGGNRDLALAFTRGVTRTALPGPHLDLARGWLAGETTPFGVSVDAELRWDLVTRLASLGEDRIDEELARDQTAQGEQHAARCRAALPDQAAKAAAWDTIVHDRRRSNRLLIATAQGFWQAHQSALTEEYVGRYFAELADLAAGRIPELVERLAAAAYPRLAVNASTVAAADQWLAMGDGTVALRRVIVDRTDDLRRALKARAR